MRRLIAFLMVLSGMMGAQTINVNQIRPSNVPGQVITTPVANQPPVWATPANSILLEHNGTPLIDQNLLNFNDTIPAAPTGFTDVLWQTDSSGNLSAYAPSATASLQMQVVPPVSGQYVVIYPTASSSTSNLNMNALVGKTYGDFIANAYCTFPGSASGTWSGFSLPSYVNPANVTAVYAFAISGNYTTGSNLTCIQPLSANVNTVQIGVTATGGSAPSLVNTTTLYGLGQSTVQITGLVGSNIPTAILSAGASNGGDFKTAAETVVASLGLIVYYTGTPPPATAGINVDPPLTYFNNNLSISPEAQFNGISLLATDTYHLVIPAKGLELINNGASSTDCSTGGGTSLVLCYWNGTGWSNFSSGGGGGGVSSINTNSGAFTFNFSAGAGSCSGTTCTFTGSGTGGLPCTGTCSAGVYPLFGSGGSSVTNSPMDHGITTPNVTTLTEGFTIACTTASCPSQAAMTYNSAAAPTVGSSTTAVYAVSSTGQAEASEAGAAFSRICTAANGVCGGGGGGGTIVASEEVVSFSATPTFSISFNESTITMTANITSFTMAAGAAGQSKTLIFCQNGTGGFTVAAPSNVHGFMSVGATASKCSSQHYTYSSVQTAWLADSSGVINQ